MKRKAKGFLNHEPDDEERQQQALELSEAALYDGLRRQLEAAVFIGAQLVRIQEQELYRAVGCETFEQYRCKYLQMARELVRRYLEIAEVIETLRRAGLELPMSEAQALLPTKIPRGRLVGCWRTVLAHSAQHPGCVDRSRG